MLRTPLHLHLQGRIPAGRGPKVKPRSSWFCGGRVFPGWNRNTIHLSFFSLVWPVSKSHIPWSVPASSALHEENHNCCGEHQYISRNIGFYFFFVTENCVFVLSGVWNRPRLRWNPAQDGCRWWWGHFFQAFLDFNPVPGLHTARHPEQPDGFIMQLHSPVKRKKWKRRISLSSWGLPTCG